MHANVEEITQLLVERFGRPLLGNKKNPFNELLFIILSSKTPPERYQEVYRQLRRFYPRVDDLSKTSWQEVAYVIARAGLQNRKARAICSITQQVRLAFGKVTLSPLADMTDEEAEAFLLSLPEVNKKTARCVLMYSLGRQVFPVDTHCFRVFKRLNWVEEKSQLTDRQTDELQEGVPKHLRRDLHVSLVLLGRKYCTPQRPRCNNCPILKFCPTGQVRVQKPPIVESPHDAPERV